MAPLDFTFLDWSLVKTFLLKGLCYSLELTAIAACGGVLIGTLLAIARVSGRRWLALPAAVYVDVMRSVPLLMVILWVFLLIPLLIGRSLGSDLSAIITFTLFEAAYFSEIMRAGIQAVSRGQVQAGLAIGLGHVQCMRHVVLPQAFRNMLPLLLTQTIILFQDTSLVYAIGAYDLLKSFESVGLSYNRPVETYILAAATYFAICFALSRIVRQIQRRIQIIR